MTDVDRKAHEQHSKFLSELPDLLKTIRGKYVCYLDGIRHVGADQNSAYRFGLERYGIDGGFVIAQVVEQKLIPAYKLGGFGAAAVYEKQVRELQDEVVQALDRLQTVEHENERLRAVIENLPVCAYGPCLEKGIWDFSDTKHGLRVYCQQHAEDRARDIGDFVEHCAELVSYADALNALEQP